MDRGNDGQALRVVQWATGTVGTSALRGIINHSRMELVGVRVFSKSKDGMDAGDLCGMPKTGVTATRDEAALLALKPDCIVYMPDRTDLDEVCRLLEAGINISTTRAEFFNPAMLENAYADRVQKACRKGNSSIYADGSSPGFITQGIIPSLLSLQRRLDLVTIDEFAQCVDTCSEDMLVNIMGFGADPSVYAATEFTERDTVFGHSLGVIAEAIGLPFDDVEVTSEFAVTTKPVKLHETTIGEGTVGAQRHTVTGMHKGHPVLRFRSNWFVTGDIDKDWKLRDDGWRIIVEGDTPIDITMHFPIGIDPETRARIMPNVTAHRPLNAVPAVCAAAPGIVTSVELGQIFPKLG